MTKARFKKIYSKKKKKLNSPPSLLRWFYQFFKRDNFPKNAQVKTLPLAIKGKIG